MGRTTILVALALALDAGVGLASPGDVQDLRPRDWRSSRLCVNCQPVDAPASRLATETRLATKLVAPNTCADPGTGAWFAEEEDHLSAFLNSAVPQFK